MCLSASDLASLFYIKHDFHQLLKETWVVLINDYVRDEFRFPKKCTIATIIAINAWPFAFLVFNLTTSKPSHITCFATGIWKSLDVIFMYSSQERWSTYGLIRVMNTYKPTHWESMQIFLRSPTWNSAPCGFIGIQRSLQLISIGIHFLSVLATREKRCFHSLLSYHKHTVQLLPQRGANERG